MMTGQRNKCQQILLLLLAASLMLSCAGRDTVRPPETSDMDWRTKTPKEILEHLRRQQGKIEDLTAAFSLSVEPPPEGQPSHMQGVLFFSNRPEGPWVRIKALGPFGRVLFDLVQKEKILQIYIPSRNTLYQGQTDQMRPAKNIWKEMLQSMFADFSNTLIISGARIRIEKDKIMVPFKNEQITLDEQTGLLLERRVPGKTIVYDRYDQQPGKPPMPTHVEVSTADNALHAACRLSQIQINQGITDAFDLSSYRPDHIRDINELDTKTRN